MKKKGLGLLKMAGSLVKAVGGSTMLTESVKERVERPEKLVYITGSFGLENVSRIMKAAIDSHDILMIENDQNKDAAELLAQNLLAVADHTGQSLKKVMIQVVEETKVPDLCEYMQPDMLIVTGFFRDEEEKKGDIADLVTRINGALDDKAVVVVNGDDLIACSIKPDNKRVTYGIDAQKDDRYLHPNIINDLIACPVCDTKLEYAYIRYNHLGRAVCPECGFASPVLDYHISNYDDKTLTLITPESVENYPLIGEHKMDLYCEVCALTALSMLGASKEAMQQALSQVHMAERFKELAHCDAGDIIVADALDKKPSENSLVFEQIAANNKACAVVLMNYSAHDQEKYSENMFWLYETDFEHLNHQCVHQIIACGNRCYEMGMRMMLAGIVEERISCVPNPEDMPGNIDMEGIARVYLVCDESTKKQAIDLSGAILKYMRREADRDED